MATMNHHQKFYSAPFSCDTFVVLPPASANGTVVFGKNSDRPADEVQEVVCVPASAHPQNSSVKCTYITIPQATLTHAVVLSKPAWMWGAEMGSNEHGVVIGNEAVWTHLTGSEGHTERLLGMDYVRLGLERGTSARDAVNVITSLLTEYGQGGRCFEDSDWAALTYCNSFIVADSHEAWVLETAGRHWAAAKVLSGVRNISNMLSIGSDIDLMSEGLKECAVEMKLWDPAKGPFHFAKAFSTECPVSRPLKGTAQYRMMEGRKLLESLSTSGEFDAASMFSVLRDEDAGICCTNACVSVGSQVSVLHPRSAASDMSSLNSLDVHWFTATPNPARSIFKPFIFTTKPELTVGPMVQSPDFGDDDPARKRPRFQKTVDRRHRLYAAHEVVPPIGGSPSESLTRAMQELEKHFLEEVVKLNSDRSAAERNGLDGLFSLSVEKEIALYTV